MAKIIKFSGGLLSWCWGLRCSSRGTMETWAFGNLVLSLRRVSYGYGPIDRMESMAADAMSLLLSRWGKDICSSRMPINVGKSIIRLIGRVQRACESSSSHPCVSTLRAGLGSCCQLSVSQEVCNRLRRSNDHVSQGQVRFA